MKTVFLPRKAMVKIEKMEPIVLKRPAEKVPILGLMLICLEIIEEYRFTVLLPVRILKL